MLASRRASWIVLGVAAALMAVLVLVQRMTPQLELGVGYAARVACGCRFIEGRSLAQCRTDFEAGMEPIRLSEDVAARSVTASVPLIARRTATLDPVLGCQAEPFRGERRPVD
jgi:hypothetical protein